MRRKASFPLVVIALGGVLFLLGGATRPVAAQSPPDSAEVQATAADLSDVAAGPMDAGTANAAARGTAWLQGLAARGVTPVGSLTGAWIGDVAGGRVTGATGQAVGYAGFEADLAKWTGRASGTRAMVDVAWLHGPSLSERFSGDGLVASNLEATPGLRLYHAWIEQPFAHDRASLRLGSQGADEEFAGTEGGGRMSNSAFGWEPGIGANVVNGGPIFFVPALGARLAVSPAEHWTVRVGAYDGDTFDSPDGDANANRLGLNFRLRGSQGAFAIAEAQHDWSPGHRALAGSARLGAWRHTADFADLRRDANGDPVASSGLDPAVHHGNAGTYATLEQRIWVSARRPARAVGVWSRVAFAPADRSPLASVFEAGLQWTAPWPGRPDDAIAIGFVHARTSPELAAAFRDANPGAAASEVPDFERVFEATWAIHAGEHLVISPDVQWIQHPGGSAALPAATVAGLRLALQ